MAGEPGETPRCVLEQLAKFDRHGLCEKHADRTCSDYIEDEEDDEDFELPSNQELYFIQQQERKRRRQS